MPATKGNKFASKDKRKEKHYPWRITLEVYEAIKSIAEREKTSIAQILEKSLLTSYPEDFSGKF